jgi:hypothetical protein
MWQELLRNKYIKDKTLGSYTKKPTDSHFWKGLMNVKDTEFWFIQSERRVTDSFLDGLGNQPLKDRFPALFNIVRRKQDSVARVLASPAAI